MYHPPTPYEHYEEYLRRRQNRLSDEEKQFYLQLGIVFNNTSLLDVLSQLDPPVKPGKNNLLLNAYSKLGLHDVQPEHHTPPPSSGPSSGNSPMGQRQNVGFSDNSGSSSGGVYMTTDLNRTLGEINTKISDSVRQAMRVGAEATVETGASLYDYLLDSDSEAEEDTGAQLLTAAKSKRRDDDSDSDSDSSSDSSSSESERDEIPPRLRRLVAESGSDSDGTDSNSGSDSDSDSDSDSEDDTSAQVDTSSKYKYFDSNPTYKGRGDVTVSTKADVNENMRTEQEILG